MSFCFQYIQTQVIIPYCGTKHKWVSVFVVLVRKGFYLFLFQLLGTPKKNNLFAYHCWLIMRQIRLKKAFISRLFFLQIFKFSYFTFSFLSSWGFTVNLFLWFNFISDFFNLTFFTFLFYSYTFFCFRLSLFTLINLRLKQKNILFLFLIF